MEPLDEHIKEQTKAAILIYLKENGKKLGIRNLNYKATKEDITSLLNGKSIKYKDFQMQNNNYHKFNGEVVVEFASASDAEKLLTIDQYSFYGRPIEVYCPQLESFKDEDDIDEEMFHSAKIVHKEDHKSRPTFSKRTEKNPKEVVKIPEPIKSTIIPKKESAVKKEDSIKISQEVKELPKEPQKTHPVSSDPWSMDNLSAGPREGVADSSKIANQNSSNKKK